MLLLSGCRPHTPPPEPAVPPPVITDAFYDVGNREYVIIKGEFFKFPSDSKLDVIATLNGRDWRPSARITESTGLNYRAAIAYGPQYPKVFVRVFGINGAYSEPFLVHN